jgi:hypothetical protein
MGVRAFLIDRQGKVTALQRHFTGKHAAYTAHPAHHRAPARER